MLNYLRYRYAKAKMAAYINDELRPQSRRFVGRLINDDERVYNEYIRQRQTKQELERELPSFGQPETGQLDALWANIQSEISKPAVPDVIPNPPRPRYSLSYGFAVLVFVLILLVPFVLDTSTISASSAQHDIPETREFTTPETPIAPATGVAVAAHVEVVATNVATDLQNTPAPKTPGQ